MLICVFWVTKAGESDTITYRSKNKFDWTDFHMQQDNNDSLKLFLNLTIVTLTRKVDVWFGIITVESFVGIRRYYSWVKTEYKSDQLFKYVQLKYDIANYYAKKCEKEINSGKIGLIYHHSPEIIQSIK